LAGSVLIVHLFIRRVGHRVNDGGFMERALLTAVTVTLVARTVLQTHSE
jgi:hypothetical protein